MDKLVELLQRNNIHDLEELDSLLELASLVRLLLNVRQYSDLCEIINYSIKQNYYEALSWIMETLQEEFAKEDCNLEDFECSLGQSIPNYDEFMQRLEVIMNPIKEDIEKVLDDNGEAQSFFNIFVYKTRYDNVYLVSSENFDTKDNDYIQYKLLAKKR